MDLTPLHLAIVVLAGVATGVIGAILGTGGGVFLVPVLVIGLSVPMHYAVATSIVTVIATSSAVASTNVERGTANMRVGITLECATALGAIAGGLTAGLITARALEGLFGLVLLPVAFLMWRGTTADTTKCAATQPVTNESADSLGALGASYIDSGGGIVTYRIRRIWAGLGISFLAGNVSGLLGIGGGVFKVPALHLTCGVPIKAAAATSNFMIGVTATASASFYYGRGEIQPALTAAVTLGVLAGSMIGTVANRWIGGLVVRKLFAVLLFAVAVQMLYRSAMGTG